jgi:hypothetical protein
MPTAEHWVSLLEQDELQMLSALSLRKIIRLGQGDWQEADRIQRDIEVRALQARAPQMFNALLSIELNAYTVARDMSGLRDSIAQLRSLAEKYPGWRADLDCAEGRFELLRGDAAAAEQAFQRCFDDIGDPADGTPRNMPAWLAAQAGMTEVLLTMERYGEAYERARAAHATARAFEAENDDLTRMLALAEAKSGDFAGAAARLDEQIAHQRTLAVTGLRIGLSYEARAQIAIWAGDEEAFATYAVHTAREYRHGAGSPLGARYERLINEARRRGIQHSVALGMLGGAGTIDPAQSTQVVTQAFSGVRTAAELARRALSLICSARGASRGHLYLVDGERLTSRAKAKSKPPTRCCSKRAITAPRRRTRASWRPWSKTRCRCRSAPARASRAPNISGCSCGARRRTPSRSRWWRSPTRALTCRPRIIAICSRRSRSSCAAPTPPVRRSSFEPRPSPRTSDQRARSGRLNSTSSAAPNARYSADSAT